MRATPAYLGILSNQSALRVLGSASSGLAFFILAACSGSSPPAIPPEATSADGSAALSIAARSFNGVATSTTGLTGVKLEAQKQITQDDAARFLTQATFGITNIEEIQTLRSYGLDAWINAQSDMKSASLVDYINQQSSRNENGKPTDEMAYEALWQQWLYSPAQLRARVAFALSQIFVISNVAPDLHPLAMTSYMDMLSTNAFGNYRKLLEDVSLHPAMGYYLNMIESEKEDLDKGTHPNENFAREVLQLFSIGLVKLNIDGTPMLDEQKKPIATYDQTVVQGFARAFSGWSFGGRDTSKNDSFQNGEETWSVPMQAWASKHSTASKALLDGKILSPGQTPQKDMADALDTIAAHPNIGPFIARRLIQRLTTSNPSAAYIQRVATVFNNDGNNARGNLKAVVRAILLDDEARAPLPTQVTHFGKQREPVIRFANLLRVTNAMADDGTNRIHYLDSADNALGQSPLLAPSVFNFYSPDFKSPGSIAAAGLNAPEFQITTETTIVGALNFMSEVIQTGSYGWQDAGKIKLDYKKFDDVAGDASQLIDRVNALLMNYSMRAETRTSLMRVINGIDPKNKIERTKAALTIALVAPEFAIQR